MLENNTFMPEAFRLGCPSIDTQHELLFAIYHELLRSLRVNDDGYDLQEVFLCLNSYVASHFKHEEDFMRATGFPGAAEHTREHQALARQVEQLRERFVRAGTPEGERTVANKVAEFLLDWLEHHIAQVDRFLCEYLLDHNVDSSVLPDS
ncbi:MAG: hemerythrin family protein [Magnetococcales bacterium]|nr:hemerythrin family protein [Magnetococcales bacterium]